MDVGIAVRPEGVVIDFAGRVEAVAPDGVVEDIVIGIGPEQRPDPAGEGGAMPAPVTMLRASRQCS